MFKKIMKNIRKKIFRKRDLKLLNEIIKENFYESEEPSTINKEEITKVLRSKWDNSYVTLPELKDDLLFLARFGITDRIQSTPNGKTFSIGYNPKNEKWYGWSHRAIFGFTVGSKIKKGDCAYIPINLSDYLNEMLNFWHDPKIHTKTWIDKENGLYFIKSKYNNKVKNESLRNTIISHNVYIPEKYGRGEWIAKTLDDAKQMAIDFANNVS